MLAALAPGKCGAAMTPVALRVREPDMSPSLLERIAAGDAGAVEEFVQRHGSAVWGLARRFCRNAQDAEDATQDILLDIWKSAERFDPRAGSDLTFALTIARRRLIDRTRRAGRRPAPELLADQEVAAAQTANTLEVGDEVARAKAALAELRPEQRQVLELALAEGRTHQEIAAAVGIPLGTVKSHARRGLLRLRELLGLAPDGGAAGGGA
jgi:RNA polymerase sigma-70 factor (ECF subfamily)